MRSAAALHDSMVPSACTVTMPSTTVSRMARSRASRSCRLSSALFFVGEIDDRGPAARVARGAGGDRLEQHGHPLAVGALERDLEALLARAYLGHLAAVQVEAIGVRLAHEDGERAADQRPPLPPDQRGRGVVCLEDPPLLAEGEVTHGREVVELEVALTHLLQLELGPLELVAARLELELADVQLVHQALQVRRRQSSIRTSAEGSLDAHAEVFQGGAELAVHTVRMANT
jgi:hypothetical protein